MTTKYANRLISVADYHRMIDVGILNDNHGIELIRGEIMEEIPIGDLHSAIVNEIALRDDCSISRSECGG